VFLFRNVSRIDSPPLRQKLSAYIDMANRNMMLSDLMTERNNPLLTEFEGYSPIEMYLLMRDPFGSNCPVQLNQLPENEYSEFLF